MALGISVHQPLLKSLSFPDRPIIETYTGLANSVHRPLPAWQQRALGVMVAFSLLELYSMVVAQGWLDYLAVWLPALWRSSIEVCRSVPSFSNIVTANTQVEKSNRPAKASFVSEFGLVMRSNTTNIMNVITTLIATNAYLGHFPRKTRLVTSFRTTLELLTTPPSLSCVPDM